VPQRFFDLYPTDSIILPQTLSNDLDDIPSEGIKLATARRKDFDRIKDAGHYKEAVRAYLASISYADHELGRILKALKTSPHAEQTITVLWSDQNRRCVCPPLSVHACVPYRLAFLVIRPSGDRILAQRKLAGARRHIHPTDQWEPPARH